MADEEKLNWEQLESSHVEAMAWIPDEARLLVQFRNGAVYEYLSDAEEADALRKADSPGRFVNFHLKHKGSRLS
jgi:hypothetical protein